MDSADNVTRAIGAVVHETLEEAEGRAGALLKGTFGEGGDVRNASSTRRSESREWGRRSPGRWGRTVWRWSTGGRWRWPAQMMRSA